MFVAIGAARKLNLLHWCSQIAVASITFVLAGRGVTHVLLKQAVAAAEETFEKFRPNLIVASSFGAVVCFQMDKPKLPLVGTRQLHVHQSRLKARSSLSGEHCGPYRVMR